ncbi:hypothetical protein [Inediibacterium massiliense]|uniref:hypothetical protein n=1 Tax=Inediibacterium massiliense TaxID=1658111 RepID=UPI0006B4F9A0|nr:hypothetical protein [Inediibacterium massiliense]
MEKELLLAIREMLKEEFAPLKNEIKEMKNRMDETYEIVKGLEHSSQVNKAEHDNMLNDIAYIKGNV